MKRSISQFLLSISALLLLSQAGCIRETIVGGAEKSAEGEALVKLSLQVPGPVSRSTRALTAAQEDAVIAVDVLVFDRNDKFFDWRHGNLNTAGSETTVEAMLVSSNRNDANDKYRIVVMANVREKLQSLFAGPDGTFNNPGGTTLGGHKNAAYAGVMALLTDAAPDTAPNASKGIPMWGELENKVTVTHGQQLGSLTLFRAFARIDVGTYNGTIPALGVDAWTALDNFKLEEVRLYNVRDAYRYSPLMSNFSFGSSINITAPSPVGSATDLVCTDIETSGGVGLGVMRGLYTGEANVVMGGTYGDGNHADRPCIVVKGYYKPSGASVFNAAPSWYRIDFVTGTGNTLHDILRNHDYQVVISAVGGAGKPSVDKALESINADMTVVIRTWSNAGLADTVIDGEYYLEATPYDFQIDKWGRLDESIVIGTNVPVTAGKSWSAAIAKVNDADDIGWISINPGYESGIDGDEVLFTADPVPGGSPESYTRSAKLRITAGTMRYDILVVQTGKDGNHLLRLSHSELTFAGRRWDADANGGLGGWANPEAQAVNVNWGPRSHDYDILLTDYTGGGVSVVGLTQNVTSTNDEPVLSITPVAIPDDDAYIASNPFHERTSRLSITAHNANHTESITKQVLIRQIYYSLVVDGAYDYYFKGRTYTLSIKSNSAWTASTDNPSMFMGGVTPSGSGKVSGEALTFKINPLMLDDARATITISSPANLFPPYDITVIAQPELPNSYIIAPGGSALIPVSKAYRVWKYDRDLRGLHPGGELPVGTYSAEVVWQDSPGLITTTNLVGDNPSGLIYVQAGAMEGNAVVAFKIDGVTYWSWHIWVTDYKPENENVANGPYTLMNRNLGAMASTPGTGTTAEILRTFGLYYQSGRKDPILQPKGIVNGTATTNMKAIYDKDGNLTAMSTENAPSGAAGPNLGNSIQHPDTFYIGSYGESSWYGATIPMRTDFYGDVHKSDYDPCPAGWKIATRNAFTVNGSGTLFAGVPMVNNGFEISPLGYFPAQGYLIYNFSFSSVLTTDTANPVSTFLFTQPDIYYPYYIGFMSLSENTYSRSNSVSRSSQAYNIRCIKYIVE